MLSGKIICILSFILAIPLTPFAQDAKSAEEIHNDAINRHRDQMDRRNFDYDHATCTHLFPAGIVRDKKVILSGYIKTENLTGGYAALWWHTDRKFNLYNIENMPFRAPKGTTGWAHFSISIPVKHDAVACDFGCLMVGKGKAWFDSLDMEIDGIPYQEYAALNGIPEASMPFLNFDFEIPGKNNQPAVWNSYSGKDHIMVLDSIVKYSGKYSLRMEWKDRTLDTIVKQVEDTTKKQDDVIEHPATMEIPAAVADTVKMHLQQSGSGTSSASAILYIESTGPVNVSILNTYKKIIIHKDSVRNVDISTLTNGIYNVQIFNDKGMLLKSGKILKE